MSKADKKAIVNKIRRLCDLLGKKCDEHGRKPPSLNESDEQILISKDP